VMYLMDKAHISSRDFYQSYMVIEGFWKIIIDEHYYSHSRSSITLRFSFRTLA
jgi:hypothetical protein